MRVISRIAFGVIASIVLAGGVSAAAPDSPAATRISTGPVSAFGESADEAAKKRVVFEWTYLLMSGHPKEAFEKYVSKNFVDHSHLVKRQCKCERPGYQEALTSFTTPRKGGDGPPPGSAPKGGAPPMGMMPTLATVDEDMVTMYNPGVDVFRVVDGKITDHWDASPAAAINLRAERPLPPDL